MKIHLNKKASDASGGETGETGATFGIAGETGATFGIDGDANDGSDDETDDSGLGFV